MNARSLLALGLGAAVLGVLSFTARSDAASTTNGVVPLLRIGMTPAFSNLDSFRTPTGLGIADLSLETLMKIGPDGKVAPNLAQSVSHPNPVTYIYTLRKGVKFWDGNPLTSADVVNALNYYRDPRSAAAYLFPAVRNITANGPNRVVVTLKRPNAAWQYAPASAATGIFEKQFGDAHKGTMGQPGVLTMGTGPWEITSFNPTSGLELSANPRYWGGTVPIRRISVKFFSDQNSMALAFRAGEIDFANLGAEGDPAAFAATSGAKIVNVPSAAIGIFSMNTKVAPWNDVHVRRAVAYALHRTELIKAGGAPATPNFTLIPPTLLRGLGSPSVVKSILRSLPSYPFSVAKAKQELAKSKYPSGFSTSLATLNSGHDPNVSQAIAAQLAKIGIKASIDLMTQGAYYAAVSGPPSQRPPNFADANAVSPDPGQSYDYLLGSKNAKTGLFNLANYTPPIVDSLLVQGYRVSDPAKRLTIYGKLLRQLAVDVPYIPIWLRDFSLAISNKFTWSTFDAFWVNRAWALEIKPK